MERDELLDDGLSFRPGIRRDSEIAPTGVDSRIVTVGFAARSNLQERFLIDILKLLRGENGFSFVPSPLSCSIAKNTKFS